MVCNYCLPGRAWKEIALDVAGEVAVNMYWDTFLAIRKGLSEAPLVSIYGNRRFGNGSSVATIDAQKYRHEDACHDILFLVKNQ